MAGGARLSIHTRVVLQLLRTRRSDDRRQAGPAGDGAAAGANDAGLQSTAAAAASDVGWL